MARPITREGSSEVGKYLKIASACVLWQIYMPSDKYNKKLNDAILDLNGVTIESTSEDLVDLIKFDKKTSSKFDDTKSELKALLDIIPTMKPYSSIVDKKLRHKRWGWHLQV